MVVGCPYILIPCRTQVSGPRFPCISIFLFNRLARLLSAEPRQIDRKWDCPSHLRTSNCPFCLVGSAFCLPRLLSGRPTAPQSSTRVSAYHFDYELAGIITQLEFCLEDSSTPSINRTPATPSWTPGTSSEAGFGTRPSFRAAICSAKSV